MRRIQTTFIEALRTDGNYSRSSMWARLEPSSQQTPPWDLTDECDSQASRRGSLIRSRCGRRPPRRACVLVTFAARGPSFLGGPTGRVSFVLEEKSMNQNSGRPPGPDEGGPHASPSFGGGRHHGGRVMGDPAPGRWGSPSPGAGRGRELGFLGGFERYLRFLAAERGRGPCGVRRSWRIGAGVKGTFPPWCWRTPTWAWPSWWSASTPATPTLGGDPPHGRPSGLGVRLWRGTCGASGSLLVVGVDQTLLRERVPATVCCARSRSKITYI